MRGAKQNCARFVGVVDRGAAADDAAVPTVLCTCRKGAVAGGGAVRKTPRPTGRFPVRRGAAPGLVAYGIAGAKTGRFTRQAVAVRIVIALARCGILTAIWINIAKRERTRSVHIGDNQAYGSDRHPGEIHA